MTHSEKGTVMVFCVKIAVYTAPSLKCSDPMQMTSSINLFVCVWMERDDRISGQLITSVLEMHSAHGHIRLYMFSLGGMDFGGRVWW